MKKIRLVLAAFTFLILFIPVDTGGKNVAEIYLIDGSFVALTGFIPAVIQAPVMFIYVITTYTGGNYFFSDVINIFLLTFGYFCRGVAGILWVYTLPSLIGWNLYLQASSSKKLKKAYRIWLLISLASSGYSGYSFFTIHNESWYWISAVLLVIASGVEIWVWIKERPGKDKPRFASDSDPART